MNIKKAVITAAGYGTRFFPITKTINKEMLPVLDRPVIDYLVNDAIEAGIKEFIIVIRQGDKQIKQYYSENKEVYKYLEMMNKLEKYERIADLHTKAKFTFVEQGPEEPYGTATPLRLVRDEVKDEDAFLMLMGDDLMVNNDGSSEAANMIKHFEGSQAEALASFIEKPDSELYKYGIANAKERDGFSYLDSIVEKPKPGTEPSNYANLSKYVFTPEIFSAFDKQEVNQTHNELLITDTVTILAETSDVVVYPTQAEYLDCGNVEGWLHANNYIADLRKES